MNNTITINGDEYVLPVDRRKRSSAMHHLMLCLKGEKTHMRFYDRYGDVTKYNALELQTAEIMCGDREIKLVTNKE